MDGGSEGGPDGPTLRVKTKFNVGAVSGGDGFDLLIGGLDRDNLKGGNGDDLVIGARVTLDNNMLNDVRTIWTNGNSYASRVAGVTGSLLTPNTNVLDDGIQDDLKGDGGLDAFFADLGGSDEDNVKDKNSSEDLFELF